MVKIDDRDLVVADVPGLIEGAHEGVGLGDRFLGHVERCGAIIHLVDAAGDHAGTAYRIVRQELGAYGAGLAEKPEIVALSKIDAVDEDTLKAQRERLRRAMRTYGPALSAAARRPPPHEISAVAHKGLTELLRAAAQEVFFAREKKEESAAPAV